MEGEELGGVRGGRGGVRGSGGKQKVSESTNVIPWGGVMRSYRRRMITGTTKPADPKKSITSLASHCWIEAMRLLKTAKDVE